MSSTTRTATALSAAALVASGLLLTQALQTTSAYAAAPSAADAAFVTANEQANLAEITLGPLGRNRGQDSATRDLATKTLTDHMTAKAKLTAAATSVGAALPSAPNAMQKAVAAQLKSTSASAFDLMYAQTQVSAHEQALAAARLEQSTTKVPALKTYTAFYIGIATMHLQMAQQEVAALGGPPAAVPAGSGGQAATNAAGGTSTTELLGFGGGAALIASGLWVGLRRRRAVTL